jgi:hypothetical protein
VAVAAVGLSAGVVLALGAAGDNSDGSGPGAPSVGRTGGQRPPADPRALAAEGGFPTSLAAWPTALPTPPAPSSPMPLPEATGRAGVRATAGGRLPVSPSPTVEGVPIATTTGYAAVTAVVDVPPERPAKECERNRERASRRWRGPRPRC